MEMASILRWLVALRVRKQRFICIPTFPLEEQKSLTVQMTHHGCIRFKGMKSCWHKSRRDKFPAYSASSELNNDVECSEDWKTAFVSSSLSRSYLLFQFQGQSHNQYRERHDLESCWKSRKSTGEEKHITGPFVTARYTTTR